MTDLGRTIANGWGAGRAIGDDIADFRMRRGEGRIREKFEQLAASEGKSLEEYLSIKHVMSDMTGVVDRYWHRTIFNRR